MCEVEGGWSQCANAIAMRVQAKKVAAGILDSKMALGGVDEKMDVDESHTLTPLTHHLSRRRDFVMKSPTLPEAEAKSQTDDAREDSNNNGIPDHPPAFKFALQLVFRMLSSVLRHPTRKPSQFARSTLNPYLTILLSFLATVLKHHPTLETLERSIPWADLASFFTVVPRKIMISQGLMVSPKHNTHNTLSDGSCLLVDARHRYLRIGVYVVWNGLGGKFLREGFGRVAKRKRPNLKFWRRSKGRH